MKHSLKNYPFKHWERLHPADGKIGPITNGEVHELLYELGVELIQNFANVNNLPDCYIGAAHGDCRIKSACGIYEYKDKTIMIYLDHASYPCMQNQARRWAYPSYKVDRTSFGIVAHEYGHFISDTLLHKNKHSKAVWKALYTLTKESERVTGYSPNMEEGFAETCKLFITNSDLLRLACPSRYRFLTEFLKLKPVVTDDYKKVLMEKSAPPKVLKAAENFAKRYNGIEKKNIDWRGIFE